MRRDATASRSLRLATEGTLDESILDLARRPMGQVVQRAEGSFPRIATLNGNARSHLVARLFTDAVFNQDIRAMQLVISRIDGGLKNDVEMSGYETEFSESLTAVLELEDGEKLKIVPEDTVMTAMCKSLVDMACRDIYSDARAAGKRKPSTEAKQERDAAMRIVIERSGGKKTTPIAQPEDVEPVKLAGWIEDSMPDQV